MTTDRDGQVNSAYSFNGLNSYILLPDSFDTSVRTISIWFNASIISDLVRIYCYDHSDLVNGLCYLSLQETNGLDSLYSTCGDVGGSVIVSISENVWHHSVAILDGSMARFYIDGQFVGQKEVKSYIHSIDGESNFILGTSRVFNSGYFEGSIDDIRIYNRALNADEINQLFLED